MFLSIYLILIHFVYSFEEINNLKVCSTIFGFSFIKIYLFPFPSINALCLLHRCSSILHIFLSTSIVEIILVPRGGFLNIFTFTLMIIISLIIFKRPIINCITSPATSTTKMVSTVISTSTTTIKSSITTTSFNMIIVTTSLIKCCGIYLRINYYSSET